jgi:hypothetical protein
LHYIHNNLWSFVLFEIFQVHSLFILLACSLLDRLTALISHHDQYAQNHYWTIYTEWDNKKNKYHLKKTIDLVRQSFSYQADQLISSKLSYPELEASFAGSTVCKQFFHLEIFAILYSYKWLILNGILRFTIFIIKWSRDTTVKWFTAVINSIFFFFIFHFS